MASVAIVTGSNRGIGPAVVTALQHVGWLVVSNGRSSVKGPGDVHVRADVATRAGAERLAAAAVKKFNRLDLLVCGVGDFFETPVAKLEIGAWEKLYRSNVLTALECCRAALPHLRKRHGSIITFGGTATQNVRANLRYVAYSMAKTALTVFTKSLAQAEGRNGVRANMINPGFIRTSNYTKHDLKELPLKVPLGTLGEPEDIGRAVVWLASRQARYVNGAVLDVGGGLWV